MRTLSSQGCPEYSGSHVHYCPGCMEILCTHKDSRRHILFDQGSPTGAQSESEWVDEFTCLHFHSFSLHKLLPTTVPIVQLSSIECPKLDYVS